MAAVELVAVLRSSLLEGMDSPGELAWTFYVWFMEYMTDDDAELYSIATQAIELAGDDDRLLDVLQQLQSMSGLQATDC